MYRDQLRRHIYDLTPTERERFEEGRSIPSCFYEYLDSLGRKDERGVYHLPDSHVKLPAGRKDPTIWGTLADSPHQETLLIKKASRFYQEPMAYADFISIRYVYSGQTHIKTLDTDFYLKENDLCLLSNGFAFSQFLHNREDLVFTFMFEKDYLLRCVLEDVSGGIIAKFILNYICGSRHPQNYIIFHGNENDRIRHAVEDMLCEYIDPSDFGRELTEIYIKNLLFEMMRCPYDYEENPGSRQSYQLAEILARIDTEYRTLTLEDLAQSLSYNRSYLSRMIREGTGSNFKDLILNKRMKMAAGLLRNSSYSVHEIMEQCGLNNTTYFYKKFREFYGCTPYAYKQKEGGSSGKSE